MGVAVPVPLRRTFTYRVPRAQGEAIALGARVRVPFGRRSVKGTVVEWPAAAPDAGVEVKDLDEALPASPTLDKHLLELTRFVADYYLCSWGEAIEAALPPDPPARKRKGREPAPSVAATTRIDGPSPTPAQARVLDGTPFCRRRARLCAFPPVGRDGLGQDRGLSARGGGFAFLRPRRALSRAGDRADASARLEDRVEIPRRGRRAPLGRPSASPKERVGRRATGTKALRRRGALRGLRAASRSRAHRRRRGARSVLQAGRCPALQRPRHRGRAGPHGVGSRRARLGDALARIVSSRACRALHAPRPGRARRGSTDARGSAGGHAPGVPPRRCRQPALRPARCGAHGVSRPR
jgi:hypothetical protein